MLTNSIVRPRLGPCLLLLLLVTGAAAQTFERIDGPGAGRTAFDPVRSRLVHLELNGSTWEWQFGQWFQRPARAPRSSVLGGIVFHPVRQRIVAVVKDTVGNQQMLEFDGADWTSSPMPMMAPVFDIVFDEHRSRLVVLTDSTNVTQVWEHDGSLWAFRSIVAARMSGCASSYDPVRHRVIVVAVSAGQGAPTGVWSYDGTSWTVQVQGAPPIRRGARIAFDWQRYCMVWRGGWELLPGSDANDWEWDGVRWTRTNESCPPLSGPFDLCSTPFGVLAVGDGRLSAVSLRIAGRWLEMTASPRPVALRYMAVDPARGTVLAVEPGVATWQWESRSWVKVGEGLQWLEGVVFAPRRRAFLAVAGHDVLSWTGTSWSPLPSRNGTHLPYVYRNGRSFAFDAARDRLITFGGYSQDWLTGRTRYFGDIMAWNGDTWSTESWLPAGGRSHAGMVYDPVRRRVLIAGGWNATGPLRDTWAWDGTAWQLLQPIVGPFAGTTVLTFDRVSGRPVAVVGPTTALQVYEHDGAAWLQRVAPTRLESEVTPWPIEAVVDPKSECLLVSTGDSLWRLSDRPSHVEVQGSGCYNAPRLAARALPRVGEVDAGIDVFGVSGPALLGLGLAAGNLSLGGGCGLLLGSIDVQCLLSPNAGGFATQILPVPDTAVFAGMTVFAQAGQLDASSPIGVAMSRRLALTIGQ